LKLTKVHVEGNDIFAPTSNYRSIKAYRGCTSENLLTA